MSIVPLQKVSLYGAEPQKDAVIQELQNLGCIHLINLQSESKDEVVGETGPTDARTALKYLRACPEQRRQVRRREEFDYQRVAYEAIQLKQDEERLEDERDELLGAMEDLQPWGEFQLPRRGKIGEVRLWFYVVKRGDLPLLEELVLPWHEIARDRDHGYVVILSPDEPVEVPGDRVQLDPRPLSQLRDRLEMVEEELEDIFHQRVGLTRWRDSLANALNQADDAKSRQQASARAMEGDHVYAIAGWVPQPSVEQIRQFAAENSLAITVQPPAPTDDPPTLLHNPEELAGSESLVTFFKTPTYRSWDPSIISYISFAIFFAMILADAGYGMVLATLVAFSWRRMGKTAKGRRTRNVLATVVSAAILYGVLIGSYFGISPGPSSLLGKLKIIDAQSQSFMMPLTILVGVLHLSIANVIMAWLQRGSLTALAPLGWVVVMAGATLAGLGTFGDLGESDAGRLYEIGSWLMIAGLVAVFLFSSQRPFLSKSPKNHLLRIGDGFIGLTGVTGLFGDVLSYLRLFALGLSSAKLAETFNNLGAEAWDADGIGVILSVAIIVFGHTICLVMGVISAVVHGLRLNCMEFFKWSLPDEGHAFQAFAKKARHP